MKTGIYKIINKINGDFYIGSALNIDKRITNHKYALKNNNHRNNYIQNAWNKYGEENFTFEIIIICKREYLLKLEQFFIDDLKPKYNICLIVTSPRIGTIHNENSKKLISDKLSKKVLQYNINGDFIKEWDSVYKASIELNINNGNISSCCNGKYKSAGGFIWKYSTNLTPIKKRKDNKIKKVNCYDKNFKLVFTYNSVTEAAIALNVNKSNISIANKNKTKCKGFYIKYIE